MTDVYAYGMLLYQTYGGKLPERRAASFKFTGEIESGILPHRPRNTFPVLCDDIWTLCSLCWAKDPMSLPPVSGILSELEDLRVNSERQALVT
ncbi:hypothetical protein AURDEDRAFT_161457 [Auricularia subglabra TFB-10046 SS5]|nr:hypothetical protein AURDEDRAFT_161457 [Auricularia subglabra TFB-10046 SS5]